MGYDHRVWKGTCGHCNTRSAWATRDRPQTVRSWRCNCGWINRFRQLPEWPQAPRSLYIGWDNSKLLKLYPVPPEEAGQSWAKPYSVRSFVYQASRALGGCYYTCRERGKVFDELVFSDHCVDPEESDYNGPARNCHVLAGWSAGEATCRLWEHLKTLCQTETERKFMQTYVRYVKDRQFPMLIPQVRVGIAERRRPDFVAFVPLQYWRYKWIAVELDHAHGEEVGPADSDRDKYLEGQKYEVLSLRPNAMGHLEEVKSLVEKFERWMSLADTDAWEVAIEVNVWETEEAIDAPF